MTNVLVGKLIELLLNEPDEVIEKNPNLLAEIIGRVVSIKENSKELVVELVKKVNINGTDYKKVWITARYVGKDLRDLDKKEVTVNFHFTNDDLNDEKAYSDLKYVGFIGDIRGKKEN